MRKITNEELEKIEGGAVDVTGTLINAIVNIVKIVTGVGQEIGSSIRRMTEGNLCPLK